MLRTNSPDALLQAFQACDLLRAGDRVLVAVSGGPDSTALLVAAHELGFDLVAAHFDHALRAGSEEVGEQVRELCGRLGVELVSDRRVSPMPRGSVQAGARALRYQFLEGARARVGADVVALAHTADDVVEGTVLHLMRGCGLAGLRGMPASRGAYVRPILAVWRRDVVAFLDERGINAYDDPANADLNFARARVRHEILPALERDRPGIGRRFYAAARQASAMQEALQTEVEILLGAGMPTAPAVAQMSEPLAVEVMKALYSGAGGIQPALSRAHLTSMLALARGGRGGRGVDLPGGRRFRIVGTYMEVIAPATARVQRRLDIKSCRGCDDSNSAHLRPGVHVRVGFRQPGLRMRPSGGRGSRKLQDILVDARVPREARDSWPLVFAGDRLAWVPGIAVDADLAGVAGEPSLHVAISPMPDRWTRKVARLETPISPRGESS
ncbi:MAG TPA: tRNA lysidine(34) synthetase TilS [Candidatus Dormibacteraeota bacterium]|nr:tRNA lysidine(34) synthetase TilS [Candidatus Dormibacteraeota bacterium]